MTPNIDGCHPIRRSSISRRLCCLGVDLNFHFHRAELKQSFIGWHTGVNLQNRMADNNLRNPCLTMHQPWASLLVHGIKRIEGRSWSAPVRGK